MNSINIINNDINKKTLPQHYKYLLNKDKDIIGPFIDNDLKKIDNDYYVSDPFKPVERDKINLLFAGCSITVGCGVSHIQKTWSYKIYELIKKERYCAGYFNVGCSGASPIEILFNIFKYIAKYGYPNYIFILFPDFGRDWAKFNLLGENRKFEEGNILNIFLFNMYSVLEDMCKTNNVKLFSTSWIDSVPGITDVFTAEKFKQFEEHMHKDMKDSFSTYYQINKKRFAENVYLYIKENDPTMTIIGNDGNHPSEAVHYAWFKEAEYQLGGIKNVNNGN